MALWTPYAEEALDLTKHKRDLVKRDIPFCPTVSDVQFAVSTELEENSYCNNCEYRITSSRLSPAESLWYQKVPSPSPSPLDSFDVDSLSDDMEYQTFERDALRAMFEKNGGVLIGNNPRMRRAVQTSQEAGDSYRRQRERNNFAAKQSRDRRKLKEMRLAFRVSYLKKKIADLRARLVEGVCVRCQRQCR